MAPIGPLDAKHEQSEEERLEVSRRYRARRTEELRELARAGIGHEVEAVGEFSTLPLESLAAIPLVGAFFAAAARIRAHRKALPPNLLLALDREHLHVLGVRHPDVSGPEARAIATHPRAAVRVAEVRPRFMRELVTFEIAGTEPLRLYTTTLRTNPWSAEVVRLLGGDAPDPLDLGEPDDDLTAPGG